MTIESTLRVIAPETKSLSVAERDVFIEIAKNSVGSIFGNQQEIATAYLAAHLATVSSRNGASGSVKSIKEDSLAITYSGAGSASDINTRNYGSTSYGIEYLRIRKGVTFCARTRAAE